MYFSFTIIALENKYTIMVAKADLVCPQSVDVRYFPKGANIQEIGDAAAISPPSFDRVRASELVSAELLSSQEVSEIFSTLYFVNFVSIFRVYMDDNRRWTYLVCFDHVNSFVFCNRA